LAIDYWIGLKYSDWYYVISLVECFELFLDWKASEVKKQYCQKEEQNNINNNEDEGYIFYLFGQILKLVIHFSCDSIVQIILLLLRISKKRVPLLCSKLLLKIIILKAPKLLVNFPLFNQVINVSQLTFIVYYNVPFPNLAKWSLTLFL
jgi:hypothetical protein